MRYYLIILIIIQISSAQFGPVNVTVLTDRLKQIDRQNTSTIQQKIKSFFLNHSWDEEYSDLEIPLEIQLIFETVSEKAGDRIYSAQCLFTNKLDQRYLARAVQFRYTQGHAITGSMGLFDPLGSLLEFYGLLIIAGEADTYGIMGGTRFYERVREIAIRGIGSEYSRGWKNRLRDVDKISGNKNSRMAKYHFYGGFGALEDRDFAAAKEEFNLMTDYFSTVFDQHPNEHYTMIFLNAHARDLAALPPYFTYKKKLLKTMANIDPDNRDTYLEIPKSE